MFLEVFPSLLCAKYTKECMVCGDVICHNRADFGSDICHYKLGVVRETLLGFVRIAVCLI